MRLLTPRIIALAPTRHQPLNPTNLDTPTYTMPLICLVTAMTAEAKPLIQRFNLKALPQSGLSAWKGDGVCLVQTGMGVQRAAARLDALLSVQSGINAFINVGIAGGDKELGEVVLASSVVDKATDRRWYPHLPPNNIVDSIDHCEVTTVAKPCTNYQADCVYDMEAAAVFRVATQHTDISRIHSVKVISDNPSHPMDDFSVKNVTPWMCNTLPTVEALIQWLATHEKSTVVDNFRQQVQSLSNHITNMCHHSVTETYQLRRLLERYLALHGHLPSVENLGQLDCSKKVLQNLENELVSYPVNY